MRRISAHYIITGTGPILKKGIIVLDKNGLITEIIDTGGALKESASVEFYSGVITPGFVNCHCHLELSHLENRLTSKGGLPAFLKEVVQLRNSDNDLVLKAAAVADLKMWHSGIVAVGDISNNSSSFAIKKGSKIAYHTFAEALGFSPERADRAMEWAEMLWQSAQEMNLRCSIVPHSPYSISDSLFRKIAAKALEQNSILSIHNQESQHEDQLYISGSGPLADHLTKNIGVDLSGFRPTGQKALATVLALLPAEVPLLLVHNTFTTNDDIGMIKQLRKSAPTWFVLCPGSNLYIENRLPDVDLLRQSQIPICLGTDGLSSNNQLSILAEMVLIQSRYPHITLSELIVWACRNGATALGMDDKFGTIECGKSPGLNLISGLDYPSLSLNENCRVKRLV